MSRRVPPPPGPTGRGTAGRTVPARGRQVAPRRNYRRWFIIGGGLVAILAVVGIVLALQNGGSTANVPLTDVVEFGTLSQEHVDTAVTYPQIPPVGGPHNARWQNCGIYNEPIQNEYAVHSLEHGAVWITYQPNLSATEIEQLRGVARGQPFVLLTPYPDLPSKVVASAWSTQLKLDSADDPRLAAFVDKYEQGPQSPEPGATCRSGIGTPIER